MASYRYVISASLILSSLWPTPAPAADRQEFPLRYRLSLRITDETGPAGQPLALSAHRLALDEEPKYRSPEPLYATLKLGLKNEAFPLVLDCSNGGTFAYDIMYLDVNRDSRLGPAKKFNGESRTNGTIFGPVKLLVDGGAERSPQWFMFQLAEYEGADGKPTRELLAINAGYYQGVVTFGAEKRLVAFVDADGNGLYNNVLRGPGQPGDRFLIDRNGDGKLDPDIQGEETQPLGRYVLVGDRFWQMDVAPDGSSVTVAPLDKPLGTIRADVTDYALLLSGEQGVLRLRSRDGTARLPAGKYQLLQCSYRLCDPAGRSWGFSASARDGVTVEVLAGKEARLDFGPPFVTRVDLTTADQGKLTLNLTVSGAGGELYSFAFFGDREKPPVPRARILDAEARELALLDFRFG
jgi:hypothetical protein